MLEINKVSIQIDERPVVRDISLRVNAGEVHAIMGRNGSGKSTLSKAIMGDPSCQITAGSILYEGKDIATMETDERARKGIFLGFQYPVEIAGLSNTEFLRSAYNACKGETLDPISFDDLLREKANLLKTKPEFIYRSLNAGFSGGEKKKNEILQMAVLEPKLAILDEIDSGLDIDALKTVAEAINTLRTQDNALILITHYHRILDFISPDYLHVVVDGKIAISGGKDLAAKIEKDGYEKIARQPRESN